MIRPLYDSYMKFLTLFKAIAASLLIVGDPVVSNAGEITAPELATFLGITSWHTKVTLPQNTYLIEICAIENGKIGGNLMSNSIDWSKDKEGRFTFIAGPNDGTYRITVASKTGGTLGIPTKISLFQASSIPSLPEAISDGTYILFVDLEDRDPKGAENNPATYKQGFVLKITKRAN